MKTTQISYSRMSNLLQTLGFEKQVGDDFVAFRHAGQDAVIVLPIYDPAERVLPAHRLGVSKIIVEKGILSEAELERRWTTAARNVRRRPLSSQVTNGQTLPNPSRRPVP